MTRLECQFKLRRSDHRRERGAMDGRRPESFYCLKVLRCAVAFVTSKTITRKTIVVFAHNFIACHFRNDRRSGDAEAAAISSDHGGVRKRDLRDSASVEQYVIWPAGRLFQRAHYCRNSRVINIDPIDL